MPLLVARHAEIAGMTGHCIPADMVIRVVRISRAKDGGEVAGECGQVRSGQCRQGGQQHGPLHAGMDREHPFENADRAGVLIPVGRGGQGVGVPVSAAGSDPAGAVGLDGCRSQLSRVDSYQ